jgi:DNA-binding NarL/FixJ family response regulator
MSAAIRTRVFIVEDSPPIRDHLVEMLDELPGVAVVGCAESPDEAIAGILRTNPDCVVLDYQLIGGTAVDVLRGVHPQAPDMIFLVLTNHPIPQYRRVCLEAGARAFFDKSLEFGKIREVIADLGPLPH